MEIWKYSELDAQTTCPSYSLCDSRSQGPHNFRTKSLCRLVTPQDRHRAVTGHGAPHRRRGPSALAVWYSCILFELGGRCFFHAVTGTQQLSAVLRALVFIWVHCGSTIASLPSEAMAMWGHLAFVPDEDYTSMEGFDAATGSLLDRRNQVGLCVEAVNRGPLRRTTRAVAAVSPIQTVEAMGRAVQTMLCTATRTVMTAMTEVWRAMTLLTTTAASLTIWTRTMTKTTISVAETIRMAVTTNDLWRCDKENNISHAVDRYEECENICV